jgi:Esterase-like activity of phytase
MTAGAGPAMLGCMKWICCLAALIAAACGQRPEVEGARAAALFREVAVDTAHGLSGLASDDAGGLWTVAERDARAYRITLDASLSPAIEALAVEGAPPDTDLEAIAVLGGDRFALGTEAKLDGTATVLIAARRGAALVVTSSVAIPEREAGIHLRENQGAEGVCGGGDEIIAALEGTGDDGGRRWTPVLRIARGEIVRRHRLWLTSRTGKVSGLDCRIAADGTVTGWAIERHFEVTRLLRFTLPPAGTGSDDVTPTVALDLDAALAGRLNLEGIAALADGQVVAVVDNQWRTITGPSALLVFRPDAMH